VIISIRVSFINYDIEQRIESSSRNNGDSNRLGPARVSLPHDVCRYRSRTYIHQPSPRSSKTWTGPAPLKSTVLHLPVPLSWWITPDVYTLLSPSLYSRCAVSLSRIRLAEVLGLLEYVASTIKSRLTTGLQRSVLNQHKQGTTSWFNSWRKQRVRSVSN
jgi:hypothetical protein